MPSRPRTVAYFELVDATTGNRMEHQPWAEVLSKFALASPAQLHVKASDREVVGKIYTYDEKDHLVLGRVRDASSPPTSYDFASATIEEIQAAADKGFIEISVVTFLEYGNVVAFMRGPHGAPLVGDLETWLNAIGPVEGIQVAVQPIISTTVPAKVKKAVAVDRLAFRAQTSATSAAHDAKGFRRVLAVAQEEYGDVEVTVDIKVKGVKKKHPHERQALLEDAQAVAAAEDVTNASARLAYGEADGSGGELVNMVRHRVTRKRDVDVVYDDAESSFEALRVRSVVREMVKATVLDEQELRAAVEA